jgi:hypothetical protein
MITSIIQKSLVHLNPLGAPNRLWCLECSTLWIFLHEGLYHFLHKMIFFKVFPKVHNHWSMLPKSTSTSHRSKNNMHCYINGKVSEFVTRTKFETSLMPTIQKLHRDYLFFAWVVILIMCLFIVVFIHVCWSFSFPIFAPKKLVVDFQLLLYFVHFHCAQQFVTIL